MILSWASCVFPIIPLSIILIPFVCREIFGPVLPILPVESLDEAIAYVNAQFVPIVLTAAALLIGYTYSDYPLAIYVFSQNAVYKAKSKLLLQTPMWYDLNFWILVFENTQSGAFIANETVIHPGG